MPISGACWTFYHRFDLVAVQRLQKNASPPGVGARECTDKKLSVRRDKLQALTEKAGCLCLSSDDIRYSCHQELAPQNIYTAVDLYALLSFVILDSRIYCISVGSRRIGLSQLERGSHISTRCVKLAVERSYYCVRCLVSPNQPRH